MAPPSAVRATLLLAAAALGAACGSRSSGPSSASTGPRAEATPSAQVPGPGPSPAPAPPPSPASEPKTLRVYVAGESIERRNRHTGPPFTATGALASPDDDNEQYGWLIPFADRLRLRDPGLTVEWVGTDGWTNSDDETYTGTYRGGGVSGSEPGRTSAISGTSIPSWLEARRGELEARRHCYDVAIAARGGNDFGNEDDADVATALKELVHLLARGSSCRPDPLVYVTGHMPDDQRDGGNPDGATYAAQQRQRFVRRFAGVVDELARSEPALRVRFVDMWTPFAENRPTTAFPAPRWSQGGVVDYGRIGREGDPMHPRRLASIYAGEVAADQVDLADLRAL